MDTMSGIFVYNNKYLCGRAKKLLQNTDHKLKNGQGCKLHLEPGRAVLALGGRAGTGSGELSRTFTHVFSGMVILKQNK